MSDLLYYILGGNKPGMCPSGKIPFVFGGSRAPMFPVIVQCNYTDQVDALKALQPLIKELQGESLAVVVFRLLSSSPTTSSLPREHCYPVLSGRAPGIYFSFDECQKQVHGIQFPKFKRKESFISALLWMLSKGTIEYDGTWDSVAHVVNDPPPAALSLSPPQAPPQATTSSFTTPTHRKTPSGGMNDIETRLRSLTAFETPRVAKQQSLALPSRSGTSRRYYEATPTTPVAPTVTPIFRYVRELHGIVETLMERPTPEDLPLPSLGPLADDYLESHGYAPAAVLDIYIAYDTSVTAAVFVDALSQRGMAEMEARFLWNIIDKPTRPTTYWRDM